MALRAVRASDNPTGGACPDLIACFRALVACHGQRLRPTRLILVAHKQHSALQEAARTHRGLGRLERPLRLRSSAGFDLRSWAIAMFKCFFASRN